MNNSIFVLPTTFQALSSHMWLVASIMDNAAAERSIIREGSVWDSNGN